MGYINEWYRELMAGDAEAQQQEAAAEAEQLRQRMARRQARAALELRRAARRVKHERQRMEVERRRADTLDDQLARWWSQQPVLTRMRPYTFAEIKAQLHGVTLAKTAGNPELSSALRRAGWRRVRMWRDSPDFARARWLPPGVVVPSDAKPSKMPTPVKRPRGRPRRSDETSLPGAWDYT